MAALALIIKPDAQQAKAVGPFLLLALLWVAILVAASNVGGSETVF